MPDLIVLFQSFLLVFLTIYNISLKSELRDLLTDLRVRSKHREKDAAEEFDLTLLSNGCRWTSAPVRPAATSHGHALLFTSQSDTQAQQVAWPCRWSYKEILH